MAVSGFDLTLKLGLYDSVYSAERMFFFFQNMIDPWTDHNYLQ